MKRVILLYAMLLVTIVSKAVGASGIYKWSVELAGFVSGETGKAPNAYLWIPDGCRQVKAVMLAQQNMTEEALYRMPEFQKELARLDVGLIWVAPWFSNNWSPVTGCQSVFEAMMTGLACQSGHMELERVPVIPFGHSAQATFPWNFAAWNPDRTLCIISFHGDAPRTNLCGYGTDNIEWGRKRNIDGIPGIMVMGEYEWWEARMRPALAFRMMYPDACISFLCDAGRGHFDCGEATALYLAKFIEKSLKHRLQPDGSLRRLNPREGWLMAAPESNPDAKESASFPTFPNVEPAPFGQYTGDRHTAFWFYDGEMAGLARKRYADTENKRMQQVGIEYNGRILEYDANVQGGMRVNLSADDSVFHVRAVYIGKEYGVKKPHMEVICGPVRQLDDTTFRIVPYEAGWDNPRRSFSIWLVAVADADRNYKGAVQPVNIIIPQEIVNKIK